MFRLSNDEDVGLLENLLRVWMAFTKKKQKHGMGGHAYNLISFTFNTKIKPHMRP